MLWSLAKVLIFLVLVTAGAFGVLYVMDNGGGMTLAFGGREFAFSPVETLILLGLAIAVFWLVQMAIGLTIATLKMLMGDETAISRFFDRNRERRGFAALADGMMALASGDGRTAISKAQKAEKLLNRPELTRLVNAQAAELSGNASQAETYYTRMLEDQRTRFVGVHGLMRQRLAKGDTETALKLAEKAFALKPKHEGVLDTLFALQTGSSDWKGARKTLAAKAKTPALTKDVALRRDALLSYADAEIAREEGQDDAAKKATLEANRLAPGLVPAAVAAAREQIKAGAPRAANRILIKAWTNAPHPDLAAAFAELKDKEEPAARRKRFEPLLAIHPAHPETIMLKTELALSAEDFTGARKALGDLPEKEPSTRALALQAAIERGTGANDDVVRGVLAEALSAPRGPEWTCEVCGTVAEVWSPVCRSCNAFDSLVWVNSKAPSAAHDGAKALMPLLKAPEEEAEAPEAIAAETESDTAPKPEAAPS
ncbi:MAG: heme biosynthesis HemY N-terminal domain-containing protein [Pseudomonadota bacterium]